MSTIYVTVSNDYLRLGEAATPNDLVIYCRNLQAKLRRDFGNNLVVNVDRDIFGTSVDGSDEDQVEAVREAINDIESSDLWVDLIAVPWKADAATEQGFYLVDSTTGMAAFVTMVGDSAYTTADDTLNEYDEALDEAFCRLTHEDLDRLWEQAKARTVDLGK